MQRHKRVVAVAAVAALALAGCSKSSDEAETKNEAAKVETIQGSNAKRIVLTPEAARRVGIDTAVIGVAPGPPGRPPLRVIPYAAVLYDENGGTWTYTVPARDVFVRAPITVDRIAGDTAFLLDGPPQGTTVVTVGAAELLGTETGVGED
jgi:hypothetical protein